MRPKPDAAAPAELESAPCRSQTRLQVPGGSLPVNVRDALGLLAFMLRMRRRDDLLGTGTEWEGDRVIGSTAETARKRPERP